MKQSVNQSVIKCTILPFVLSQKWNEIIIMTQTLIADNKLEQKVEIKKDEVKIKFCGLEQIFVFSD